MRKLVQKSMKQFGVSIGFAANISDGKVFTAGKIYLIYKNLTPKKLI